MSKHILATSILALCLGVGCDTSRDVDTRDYVQVKNAPLASDIDDVQAAALTALFSADIKGDVPLPAAPEFFAVILLDKRTPDEEFLGRFATQNTKVIALPGGYRKPKHPSQETGLYFRVESVSWLDANRAAVDVSVDNGWGGAGYNLNLSRAKAGWSCDNIKRMFWID